MQTGLIDVLAKRGVLRKNSMLLVEYLYKGVDGVTRKHTGDFIVEKLYVKNEVVSSLLVMSVNGEYSIKIKAENILKIEDMDESRISKSYDVHIDGRKRECKLDQFGNPLKRGRKTNETLKMIKNLPPPTNVL